MLFVAFRTNPQWNESRVKALPIKDMFQKITFYSKIVKPIKILRRVLL